MYAWRNASLQDELTAQATNQYTFTAIRITRKKGSGDFRDYECWQAKKVWMLEQYYPNKPFHKVDDRTPAPKYNLQLD